MPEANGRACSLIYQCTRAQMVPMIRALRRCTAAEALESMCSSCIERGDSERLCPGDDTREMSLAQSASH